MADLRKLQAKSSDLANEKLIDDQALLTLVGISLLQKYYGHKKNCWSLVVNKAFYAIKQTLDKTYKRDVSQSDI